MATLQVMPFEEAIEMLKKSIKKMYGKKGTASFFRTALQMISDTAFMLNLPPKPTI